MRIVEVNQKRFTQLSAKYENLTIYQTKEWAKFCENIGWHIYYVSLEEKDKSYGCSLILSKEFSINKKKIFYCPRGFLTDYNDEKNLNNFTQALEEFAKKKNAVVVKINPFIELRKRNNDGKKIESNTDNTNIYTNLINMGYKYCDTSNYEPRFLHMIDIKNKTIEMINSNIHPDILKIIDDNKNIGITTREITNSEINKFKFILQNSIPNPTINHEWLYYKKMWDALYDIGFLKIIVAEINFDVYEKNILNLTMTTDENNHQALLEKIKDYKYTYGHSALIGGVMILNDGKELTAICGGNITSFEEFNSIYSIYYNSLKYAIENKYYSYNLYEVSNPDTTDSKINAIKKSFGGNVIELLGEYDLILSPFWYKYYKLFKKKR